MKNKFLQKNWMMIPAILILGVSGLFIANSFLGAQYSSLPHRVDIHHFSFDDSTDAFVLSITAYDLNISESLFITLIHPDNLTENIFNIANRVGDFDFSASRPLHNETAYGRYTLTVSVEIDSILIGFAEAYVDYIAPISIIETTEHITSDFDSPGFELPIIIIGLCIIVYRYKRENE